MGASTIESAPGAGFPTYASAASAGSWLRAGSSDDIGARAARAARATSPCPCPFENREEPEAGEAGEIGELRAQGFEANDVFAFADDATTPASLADELLWAAASHDEDFGVVGGSGDWQSILASLNLGEDDKCLHEWLYEP